jgi:hypothetical protein
MQHRQPRHSSRGRLLAGGALAAILLTATAVGLQWQQVESTSLAPPAAAPPESRSTPRSQQESLAPAEHTPSGQPALADQLVGVWQLHKHGERTLQVHADGTATVRAKLEMLGALMYGERMTLKLQWTLEGDVMTQTISSGTPAESVQRLIRDWGDRREYRVIEVSDEQLVLSELGDDGDREVWTSVPRTPSSTASQKTQSPR